MPVTMIMKKDIEHAIIVDGKKRIVYDGKPYKPIKRFFGSTEAIRYARDNKYSLIVSITDERPNLGLMPSRWLIMEEVTNGKR